MDADNPRIVVEVPTSPGNFTPANLHPPKSKLDDFRNHWLDILAPPDNLGDLVFDSLGTISITAFITSAALFTPIPNFIRVMGWVFIAILGLFLVQILRNVPELRAVMSFRLSLVGIGVILGL